MTRQRLFALGQVVSTPNALAFAQKNQIDLGQLLTRHQTGDWGDLEDEDKESNEEALINDTRIFSSYSIAEDKIWFITEADRSLTTFLMPSDYWPNRKIDPKTVLALGWFFIVLSETTNDALLK